MPTHLRATLHLFLTATACALALAACAEAPAPVVKERTVQLRVRNEGPADAAALRVLFPAAEIDFGDVPSGATSAYRPVPGGVYAYGAYRVRLEGREVTVPVIDWVGESPLPGAAFTYVLAVDPRVELPVRLVRVDRDR